MLRAIQIADDCGMANFNYQIHHGHVIVHNEGRPYLLDTGAPFSVGYQPIHIGASEFPVEHNYLGITSGYLGEHIGARIEGMIGADIIQQFNLSVYSSERVMQFNHLPPVGDIVLPLKDFLGVPVISVAVAGRVYPMFFDTGAPLSYLLPEYLQDAEPVGRHEDFYPLLGHFLTPIYDLPVDIGGVRRVFRFGAAPEELRGMLEAGNVRGIIGTEMFRCFSLCLSLRERVMRLESPQSITDAAVGRAG